MIVAQGHQWNIGKKSIVELYTYIDRPIEPSKLGQMMWSSNAAVFDISEGFDFVAGFPLLRVFFCMGF